MPKNRKDDIAYLMQSADVQCRAGDYEGAARICSEGLKAYPGSADLYSCLGDALRGGGRYQEAILSYRKAIELKTDYAGTYYQLAALLQGRGEVDEALALYQKALHLNPNHADTFNNIGAILQDKHKIDEAMAYYQQALKIAPNSYMAFNNLGNAFYEKGQVDEAITLYRKSIQLNPHFAGSYYNLGVALHNKKQFREAVACYQKTIGIDPDFADAYFNISLILLLLGNFRDGFKLYEWRRKMAANRPRFFSQPEWTGSDIHHLTILLHAEQGFGDAIQFIRYAPLIAQSGARVIVECQKELASLFQTVEGIQQIVVYGEKLPAFDLHCPFMSLPLIFETTLDSVPAGIPYIRADARSVKNWADRIGIPDPGLRIGIAWAGRAGTRIESGRSCPLSLIAALTKLKNATCYSLQKGGGALKKGASPAGIHVIDYTDELKDFADTASFIMNLDLVVSVDTAVAHLAGALGKPVLTLLPFLPDWRWMLDRDDSPWYPTMKLFRQPSPGNWEAVIDMVLQYIGRRMAEGAFSSESVT
jgi:tetratricopeptide (TPR) repeat protein